MTANPNNRIGFRDGGREITQAESPRTFDVLLNLENDIDAAAGLSGNSAVVALNDAYLKAIQTLALTVGEIEASLGKS